MDEARATVGHGGARTRGDVPVTPRATARRGPSRGRRVAFAVVALLASWLACEGLAWAAYRVVVGKPFSWSGLQEVRRERAARPEGVGASVMSQVHPYVGYVREPAPYSGQVRRFDGKTMPISNYGYIDDKDPIQKRAAGKVIVGILGGSMASFFGVDGAHRLEEVLRTSPEYADKEIVCLNLALGGYKQPQQLTTLAYLTTLGAEFDVVVNIDGFNEVALYELENAGHHVHPAFPRSWRARVGPDDSTLGVAKTALMAIEGSRDGWARWASASPWRWSIVCNLVWTLRDRRLERDAYELVKAHQELQGRSEPYVVTGPPRDFASRAELYEELASIWSNGSLGLDALCKESGARYFHFLQPNQYDGDSKPMDAAERRLAFKEDHPYRKGVLAGYPLLRRDGEALRRRGVAFHDLSGLFRDHPEGLYVDDCCHVNQRGLELIAEAVGRAILEGPGREPRSR